MNTVLQIWKLLAKSESCWKAGSGKGTAGSSFLTKHRIKADPSGGPISWWVSAQFTACEIARPTYVFRAPAETVETYGFKKKQQPPKKHVYRDDWIKSILPFKTFSFCPLITVWINLNTWKSEVLGQENFRSPVLSPLHAEIRLPQKFTKMEGPKSTNKDLWRPTHSFRIW